MNTNAQFQISLLLVDDEEPVRLSLKRLLSRDGYHVLTAGNGKKALSLLRSQEIDLILADYMMPAMSGVDLLLRVKRDYPEVIRLLLTGRQEVSVIKEAINRAGIFHFVSKPWEDEELRLTIQRAVEHRKMISLRERLKIENAVVRELSTLKGISGLLYEADGIEAIFACTLEQMVRLTKSESGIGLIKDEGTGLIKMCCSEGDPDREIKNNDKILKWMEMTRQSILVSTGQPKPELPLETSLDTDRPMIIAPLFQGGSGIGMIGLFRPHNGPGFTELDVDLAEALACPLVISIQNSRLHDSIRKNFYATIKSLATAIEAKDPYTRGHSERVMSYSISVADELHLSPQEKSDLRFAALLHDIGKIGVPDSILHKAGKLSDVEYAEIEKHPFVSAKIINNVPALRRLVPIVESHHERYDGRGYPVGLAGSEIPLNARILAVADVFEALTSDRPYRKAIPEKEAIKIINSGAGSQFDRRVVRSFLKRFEAEKLSRPAR